MNNLQMGVVLQHLRRAAARRHEDELPDEQLLERFARQREESAFAALLRRHGPMVLNVCRGILRHGHDVEDAFQATFLVLAQKAAGIRRGTSVGGWLYEVAYHIALKAQASAARRRDFEKRTPDMTRADPLDDMTVRELRRALHEELRQLPEKYRTPLVLCYLEGKTQEEAARQLGWPKRRVKDRLQRGREQLRRRLSKRGLAPVAALTTALFAADNVSATLAGATVGVALKAEAATPAVAVLAQAGCAVMAVSKAKVAMLILLAGSLLGGAGLWLSAKPQAAVAPSVANANDKSAASPKREAVNTVEIQGRVFGPDGKPKAGARLLLLDDDKTTELGVSAADGRFTVAVPKKFKDRYLVVQFDGTGIDFLDLARGRPRASVELRLVKDEPIRGRVVNTEGKPVRGVRVAVDNLGVYPNNSLDSFLAIWKKRQRVMSGLPNGEKHIWNGASALFAATTDADGRFTIPHVGDERLVSLRLSGEGIADAKAWIVNRRGFDPKPYNEAMLHNSSPQEIKFFGIHWHLYGPGSSLVTEAGKTIRGVVKDADSGKGRPGVEVILSKDGDGRLLPGPLMKARTDGRGRYEIRGARKGKSYMVEVANDAAVGYMACQVRVEDTAGYQPVVANIGVKKGAIITGKVIDQSTGKPILGWVRVGILTGNRFAEDYPTFDSSAWIDTPRTDDDGTFRVVTVPGPVLLMGGPDERRLPGKRMGCLKYKPVVPDPQCPQYFSKKEQRNSLGVPYVFYGYQGIVPLSGNFCKVLDLKPGSPPVKQDILLEAGAALPIRIQDAEGQPLANTFVTGMGPDNGERPILCETDACSAYHLEAGKPRLMVFYHPERKLTGSRTLKGDEKQPVMVKLGPTGAIEGRLLDADGKPLAGIVIEASYQDGEAEEIHQAIHEKKQIVTDADGTFTLDELIPALKFELSFRHGKRRFERISKPAEASIEIKPGETREIGTIKLKLFSEKAQE